MYNGGPQLQIYFFLKKPTVDCEKFKKEPLFSSGLKSSSQGVGFSCVCEYHSKYVHHIQ